MSSMFDPPPPRQRGHDSFTTMISGAIFLAILFLTLTLVASCIFGGD